MTSCERRPPSQVHVASGEIAGMYDDACQLQLSAKNGVRSTYWPYVTQPDPVFRNTGTTYASETAGSVAHEGQNGITGRFFGQPSNHEELLNTEVKGFTAQSYVNEGMNTTSPYGLWKNGWAETPETQAARADSAYTNAHDVAYPPETGK